MSDGKRVTLVTGASSGIGTALARLHAQRGDSLVLVARREEKLEQLKGELESRHPVTVHTLAVDLTSTGAPERVAERIEELGLEVENLVNNAGFGGRGLFHEQALEENRRMVQLNVTALMALTRLLLPGMIQRGEGRLLHVASTAGLVPGPLQAVYYATKAFVVSFGQALAEELRGTGVSSTVLAPGPVRTEFARRADLEGTSLFRRAVSPEKVARVGYEGMMKGRLVVSEAKGFLFALRFLVPFVPRRLALRISRAAQE